MPVFKITEDRREHHLRTYIVEAKDEDEAFENMYETDPVSDEITWESEAGWNVEEIGAVTDPFANRKTVAGDLFEFKD